MMFKIQDGVIKLGFLAETLQFLAYTIPVALTNELGQINKCFETFSKLLLQCCYQVNQFLIFNQFQG